MLGWDPMVLDAFGKTAGDYYCGETGVDADGREIVVVNSFNSDVSFAVVDITDRAMPMLLGEYLLPNVQTYDVAVTDDAQYVIVGANPQAGPPSAPSAADAVALPDATATITTQPVWRDACTGEERVAGPEQSLPLAPGAVLVDISDPTNPTFADFQPTPVLGPHSVYSTTIDGTRYALASITNLEHQSSYFSFYEVTDTLLGGRLVPLTTYEAPRGSEDSSVPLINGHVDGTIQKHPVTGQIIAYLANWDAGVVLLDISNPNVPAELARWGGASNQNVAPGAPASFGDDDTGAIHGTYPIEGLWGDRHITFAGQELGGRPADRPSGWIFILDTTDPANPTEIGRWTIPVDIAEWDGFLQFSTHYFTVVARTLFVSTYHGGVWAVDVSGDDLSAPDTLGVFVPDRISPAPPEDGSYDETLDVLALDDGALVAFSSNSGAYTLRFDPSVGNLAPASAWVVETRADAARLT